jgi:hydroxyacylglutathione hydrolase
MTEATDDRTQRERGAGTLGPVTVAPGVRRLTCDNPSPMTHTGTQTYIVGAGPGPVAVIDPGPDDARHLAAIEAALDPGQRIAAILVTHSHRDHSPAARPLARATGAPVLAFGPHGAGMSQTMLRLGARHDLGGGEGADAGFTPDRCLADGESLQVGAARFTALHTPGHLSNHLCFALNGPGMDAGILFTGDTVMGWSSTLVSPPEGDMAGFMTSLRRLQARCDRLLLPGHGDPVTDPARLLAAQITHREARAAQILATLATGAADSAALTVALYTDVSPALWPAARRNVLATLIWLAEEGRLACDGAPGPETPYRLA